MLGKGKLKCFFPILFILNICVSVSELAGVFMRMQLINSIAENEPSGSILFYVASVIILSLCEFIVLIAIQAAEIEIKKKYKFHAVEMVADKCATLPLIAVEQRKSQEIIYKAKEFFQKSVDLTQALSRFANFVLILLALTAVLSHTQPIMFFAFAFLICIAFLFSIRSSKSTFGFWSRYMSNARRYNYFSDIQTKREYAYERRSYNTSQAMDSRFSDAFDEARRVNRKSGMTRFYGQSIVEGITISASTFTMFYFARPDSLQGFTVGAYAAITELVTRLLGAVSTCPESIFTIREFNDLKKELEGFLVPCNICNTLSNSKDLANNKDLDTADNACIVFNHVSFSYPPANESQVISDFTYSFAKGVHYGLVGVNAAGKTTTAKLLLGLYAPTCGEISISIASATAIFQDFQIYPITVREYLLMGNDHTIADSTLLSVLSRLDCNNLRNGLDTPISLLTDEGTLFSQGQFQRLAIARICLSDAELVILDEPTASLDPISEKKIYETCMDILSDRTCVFISHRLGAVRNMDEILVVDGGVLCESGSHAELVGLNGLYSKLYSTQRGLYIDE
jgi:ATP-binding cassette subfamily B protein